MEKIIFILLPIIYFLYKAYLNFKKEQEKAVKRASKQTQSIPNIKVVQNNKNTTPKYYQDPIRQENKDYESDIREYLNKNKLELESINKAAREVNKYEKVAVADYYNPETPSPEVVKNREIHLDHHHEFEFPSYLRDEFMDFDLRKALIYDTILKRPNY